MQRAFSDIGRDGDQQHYVQHRPLRRQLTDTQSWSSSGMEGLDDDGFSDRPTGTRLTSRVLNLIDMFDSTDENTSPVRQASSVRVTGQGGMGRGVGTNATSSNSRLKRTTAITNIAAACDSDSPEQVYYDRGSIAAPRIQQQQNRQQEPLSSADYTEGIGPMDGRTPSRMVSSQRIARPIIVSEEESPPPATRLLNGNLRRPNETQNKRMLPTKMISDESFTISPRTGAGTRQLNAGRRVVSKASEDSVSVSPRMRSNVGRMVESRASEERVLNSPRIKSVTRQPIVGRTVENMTSKESFSVPTRIRSSARQPSVARPVENKASEERLSVMRSSMRQQSADGTFLSKSSIAAGKIDLSDNMRPIQQNQQNQRRLGARPKTNPTATVSAPSRTPRTSLRPPALPVVYERRVEDEIDEEDYIDEWPIDEDADHELFRYLEAKQMRPTNAELRQTASVSTIRAPDVATLTPRGRESEEKASHPRTSADRQLRQRPNDVAQQRRQQQFSGDGNHHHQYLDDIADAGSDECLSPRPTRTDRQEQTTVDLGRLSRPVRTRATTGPDTNKKSDATADEVTTSSVKPTSSTLQETPNSSSFSRLTSPLTTRKSVRFTGSGDDHVSNSVTDRLAPVDGQVRSPQEPSQQSSRQGSRFVTTRRIPLVRTPVRMTPRDAGRITLSFASRVSAMMIRFVKFVATTCVPYCYDAVVTHIPQIFLPLAQEPSLVEAYHFMQHWYHIVTDSWESFFNFIIGAAVFGSIAYVVFLCLT